MIFKSKKDLLYYLKGTKNLGFGSQGVAYYDSKVDKVLKIYRDFFDDPMDLEEYEWKKEDILKFPKFKNSTFVFPEELLIVEDRIIGYTSRYVNGVPLDSINPLKVNLNCFIKATEKVNKDIDIVSKHNIMTYDVIYNIIYGKNKFNIIDTDEYSLSNSPEEEINFQNHYNFNIGIKYFLIDAYLDDFVRNHNYLNELYNSKDSDILLFLYELKKTLSEHMGKEVVRIEQAKDCLNKRKVKANFVRIKI